MISFLGSTLIWLLPLGLYFVLFALNQIVMKKLSAGSSIAKINAVRFFFSALIIWSFAFFTNSFQFDYFFLAIAAVGFFNAIASYSQWQAIKYSVSRTSLIQYPLMNVITITLAAAFLDETSIYNTSMTAGVTLTIIGALLLAKKDAKEKSNAGIKWLFFVTGAIVIWGGAEFMIKFFSFTVPQVVFQNYWYLGSLAGSLPLVLANKDGGDVKQKISGKNLLLILSSSVFVLLALVLSYWTLQLAPAGAFFPIRLVGLISIPIAIGWLLFNEKKGLTKTNWLGLIMGITGAVLIIISRL